MTPAEMPQPSEVDSLELENRGEQLRQISEGIASAGEYFKSLGYDYRLAGGFAVETVVGKDDIDYTEILRGDRDVDFILLDNVSSEEVAKLKAEASEMSGLKICISHSRVLKFHEGLPVLKYRQVEVDIPRHVLDPVPLTIGDTDFESLAPATLFHIYATAGFLRPKDFPRILALGRKIRENSEDAGPREEDFVGFHSFLKQRMQYKSYQALVAVQKVMGQENYRKLMESPAVKETLRGVYSACYWTESRVTQSLGQLIDLPETKGEEENA